MMKSTKKLTVEQHRAFGSQLLKMRGELRDVCPRYPQGSPPDCSFARLMSSLDHFRNVMNQQAAKDLGPAFDIQFYYPREN
jgi:hypothetical protein